MPAGFLEQAACLAYIVAATDERHGKEVDVQLGRQLDVLAIDIGQRRCRQTAAFLVDALVIGQDPAIDDGRVNPRAFNAIDLESDHAVVEQ